MGEVFYSFQFNSVSDRCRRYVKNVGDKSFSLVILGKGEVKVMVELSSGRSQGKG